jgi:hypothetical protein
MGYFIFSFLTSILKRFQFFYEVGIIKLQKTCLKLNLTVLNYFEHGALEGLSNSLNNYLVLEFEHHFIYLSTLPLDLKSTLFKSCSLFGAKKVDSIN